MLCVYYSAELDAYYHSGFLRDFLEAVAFSLLRMVSIFFRLFSLFPPFCSYADRDQLQAIYSAYLQPVLSSSLKSHPVWGAVKNVHTLAGSMVSMYEQVSVQP